MKRSILRIILVSFALSLLLGSVAVAQDFKVIVNENNSITSISKVDLSKIFLKKKSKWEDGSQANPVDLAGSIKDAFSNAIHGKSAKAIKSYWQKQIFSGKSTPPSEVKSDAEVIAFVKSNPGSIGYVSPSADTAGVKEVPVQ